MSLEKLKSLVNEIGKKYKFTPTEDDYSSFEVILSNVSFLFMYEGNEDEDSLYVYCEYGELPSMYNSEILEKLLESNFLTFGSDAPTYSIDRITKCVTQMFRVSVSTANIDSLHELMKRAAFQANLWSHSYFLDPSQLINMAEKVQSAAITE